MHVTRSPRPYPSIFHTSSNQRTVCWKVDDLAYLVPFTYIQSTIRFTALLNQPLDVSTVLNQCTLVRPRDVCSFVLVLIVCLCTTLSFSRCCPFTAYIFLWQFIVFQVMWLSLSYIQIKTPDVTSVSGTNEKTAAVAEVTMSEGPDVQNSIHVDSQ